MIILFLNNPEKGVSPHRNMTCRELLQSSQLIKQPVPSSSRVGLYVNLNVFQSNNSLVLRS